MYFFFPFKYIFSCIWMWDTIFFFIAYHHEGTCSLALPLAPPIYWWIDWSHLCVTAVHQPTLWTVRGRLMSCCGFSRVYVGDECHCAVICRMMCEEEYLCLKKKKHGKIMWNLKAFRMMWRWWRVLFCEIEHWCRWSDYQQPRLWDALIVWRLIFIYMIFK